MKDKYKSIDLFAGIGGIRLGFEQAFENSIETVFVSEWDEYAQKTYKANFTEEIEVAGDITKIQEDDIPQFDICLAGFPCQAFSLAGQRKGFDDDYKGMSRGTLFFDVVRICNKHKPKVIFCENVKGLTVHDKGRTFKIITKTLEQLGYSVYYKILNSRDFGVPQNRERIYIVAFRNDINSSNFSFPEPLDTKAKLKDIVEKDPVSIKYYLSTCYLQTLVNHKARHEAKGNGFGYEIRGIDGIAGAIVCGGMGRERNLIIDDRLTDFTPVTHIKGEVNRQGIRKMTPREWARLQGFPETFKLPLSDVHLYKQFGNSVTVPVIKAIAEKIKEVLIMPNILSGNKGEWSELYAFIKLLNEGKIYAADQNVNRIDNIYLPIIQIIREEIQNEVYNYFTGPKIKIYKDNQLLEEIELQDLAKQSEDLFSKIFAGNSSGEKSGAFSIDIPLMSKMFLKKIKAPSANKIDMMIQIHDINTGFSPKVGFSVKSDIGSPPTLFNAGKNTRIQYKITGLNEEHVNEINNITEKTTKFYIKERISKLFESAENVEFVKVKDATFRNNLIMIDSLLPQIYGEMVLDHYKNITKSIYNCTELVERINNSDPIQYQISDIYKYKFKKLISASALGMTPGKLWNGLDAATGGYIIIKKDGDILCYHLYNRNYFEEYLLNNTCFDRPSAKKYDYGYIYCENNDFFIDFNVQVRFKRIPSS